MKFNLKDIKMFKARNGYGMTATLVINNTDVCTIRDAGDGSAPDFDVINKPLFELFDAGVKELPEIFIPQYGFEMKIDKCLFIDMLHYALESKTEFTLLSA